MTGKNPLFAIIVPFKAVDKFALECIEGCLSQTMQGFELILLPDKPIERRLLAERFGKKAMEKIKCIPTGQKLPKGAASAKRNIGIESTKAEFIACIDSDAYPEPEWLESALPLLRDEKVAAVGGPNLEPKNIGLWESLAIKTMHLYLTDTGLHDTFQKHSGAQVYRELPTSNIIIKRNLLLQIGKFDESLATGEDVKACILLRKTGKLILFNRKTAVHHHNLRSFSEYLPRLSDYGRGKIRVLQETNSFRMANALVIAFLLYVILAPFAGIAFPIIWVFYAASIMAYAIIAAIDCLLHSVRPVHVPFCVFIVFLTHLAYGIGTLQALLLPEKNLERRV